MLELLRHIPTQDLSQDIDNVFQFLGALDDSIRAEVQAVKVLHLDGDYVGVWFTMSSNYWGYHTAWFTLAEIADYFEVDVEPEYPHYWQHENYSHENILDAVKAYCESIGESYV